MSRWWDNATNVHGYIDMVADSKGLLYLEDLQAALPAKSRLLELGMGPGKDLDILIGHYEMTGSDLSPHFLNLYQEKHPEADLVLLDAISLEMPESHSQIVYDGVISNKVLVHLNPDELRLSLKRQLQLIRPGGVLCHSLWAGEGNETFHGLYFHYWNSESLSDLIPEGCDLISLKPFKEEQDNDSLLLILRRED